MAIGRAASHFSTFSTAAMAALVLTLAACSVETTPTDRVPASAAPKKSPIDAPAANPSGSGETTSVVIDNATGGQVALSDGTRLDIPAGALPPGVDTITVTSSTAPAPTEYRTVAPIYVFGPDGTVFLKPVTISFPVTVPAGTSTADLTILWSRPRGQAGFDMVPATFTPTGSGTSTYVVSGEVNHFSEGTCGHEFADDPHPTVDPYQN